MKTDVTTIQIPKGVRDLLNSLRRGNETQGEFLSKVLNDYQTRTEKTGGGLR